MQSSFSIPEDQLFSLCYGTFYNGFPRSKGCRIEVNRKYLIFGPKINNYIFSDGKSYVSLNGNNVIICSNFFETVRQTISDEWRDKLVSIFTDHEKERLEMKKLELEETKDE
jgi:hypothetical protein